MIETGRLTAEEGLRLLEALNAPKREPGGRGEAGQTREPNRVVIHVTELGTGRRRVQADLPMALVDLGLRALARSANRSTINIAGEPIDPEALRQAARSGARGRVLYLVDDQENVKVEVFLE